MSQSTASSMSSAAKVNTNKLPSNRLNAMLTQHRSIANIAMEVTVECLTAVVAVTVEFVAALISPSHRK